MVIVGFFSDAVVNDDPSTTNRFFTSCIWLNLLSADFFGSSPMTLPTLLETYVRTGKVRYVLHDFPLDSLHPMAPAIATAAACVAEQGAARFWQMHDALFQAQQQLSGSPEPGAVLAATARTIGADVPAYQECMSKAGPFVMRVARPDPDPSIGIV